MKNTELYRTALIFAAVLWFATGVATAQTPNDRREVQIQTNLDCHACKQKIEKFMAFEKGVTSVVADVPTKIVTIGYRSSRTNVEKLSVGIRKIGYTAEVISDKEARQKK